MKLLFFKRHFNNKKANKLLFYLILLDLLFICLHIIFIFIVFIRIQFDWSIVDKFMVNADGGYPEIFQYFKFGAVSLILLYFIFKGKSKGNGAWLLLYLLLLLDDSLQLHERFGAWISEKFNYAPMIGLRAQDLGELTYSAVFGTAFLLFFAIGYYFGNEKYRKVNIDLILLFGILLFFGIGIDMLDEMVATNRYSTLFFVLLEDGGEMIALSLILWYCYFLVVKPKDHDTYLYEYFYKGKLPFI